MLSPSQVPEVFSESTARLVERAAELVELAAATWLVTGRHPVHVLAGAVYVAWLSLNPCKARLAVPLSRFFKMAKVALPGKAALRVTELKEVLCQLGKELPWLRGAPVDPRTVPTLTADILKHRFLLMRKAMRSFESQLDAGPDPAAAEPLPGPDPAAAEPLPCPDPAAAEPLPCPDSAAGGPPVEPKRMQEEGEEATIRSGKTLPATQMQASDWPIWETSRSNTDCPQGKPSPFWRSKLQWDGGDRWPGLTGRGRGPRSWQQLGEKTAVRTPLYQEPPKKEAAGGWPRRDGVWGDLGQRDRGVPPDATGGGGVCGDAEEADVGWSVSPTPRTGRRCSAKGLFTSCRGPGFFSHRCSNTLLCSRQRAAVLYDPETGLLTIRLAVVEYIFIFRLYIEAWFPHVCSPRILPLYFD